jgi:hypothetical protein
MGKVILILHLNPKSLLLSIKNKRSKDLGLRIEK